MFKNQKKIRFENNYSNNLKHDLNKEYDSIGNIISLIYYDMGMVTKREDINRFDRELKKHGVWKTFYKNGNLKSKQIDRPSLPQGRLTDLIFFPAVKVLDSKYFSLLLKIASYI